MEGKGPREERETVINFNDAEDTAWIWTASEVVCRRLKKLGYIPKMDDERSVTFVIPKSHIRLPRPKRPLTPGQMRARLKGLNSLKSALPVGTSTDQNMAEGGGSG